MGSGMTHSMPREYFEDVYGANDDPWGFETSPYEAAKYAATIAALPRARYRSGFEIGCSLGVLTERLALVCDHLIAVDTVAEIVKRAVERCGPLPHVEVRRMHLPEEFPDGRFDLIVLSEVGYYFSLPALTAVRDRLCASLEKKGHLLLVHWTPFVHDYPLTGDEVHAVFLEWAGPDGPFRHLHGYHAETYRLDLLERM